jgi:CTP synthase (UTP-ammonia lyase)
VQTLRVGLIGDYDQDVTAHRAIPEALGISARTLGAAVEPEWLPTDEIDDAAVARFERFHGLWCVPASPYRSMDGALRAIRYARETETPFLGTCGGFQHTLIEYARHVAGIDEADHAESSPEAANLIVAPLACPLVEAGGTVCFTPGSRLRAIYGADTAHETYRCSYGLNPGYEKRLGSGALHFVARDPDGTVRACELHGHRFFFATLYQPERSGLRAEEHPLITAFVRALVGA